MKKLILSLGSILFLLPMTGCQMATRFGTYAVGPGQYIVTAGPVYQIQNKRAIKVKSIDPNSHETIIDVWIPPYNIAKDDLQPTREECYRKARRKALERIAVLDDRLSRFPKKNNRERFRHEHLILKLHSSENQYKLTRQYQAECLKKLGFRYVSDDQNQ